MAPTLLDDLGDNHRRRSVLLNKDNMMPISIRQQVQLPLIRPPAPAMPEQARRLFAFHANIDLDYIERRIRHESAGEYGIAILRS